MNLEPPKSDGNWYDLVVIRLELFNLRWRNSTLLLLLLLSLLLFDVITFKANFLNKREKHLKNYSYGN